MSDQYDAILRALEPGVVLTLNNAPSVNALPTGELVVAHSATDKTSVTLKKDHNDWYKIHRERSGNLVYEQITEDGHRYEDEVISIEIVGIKE